MLSAESPMCQRRSGSTLIERVLTQSAEFRETTGREKTVCLAILLGHTSESIGLNHGISKNTVLTYRKRLYAKLGISSQNELFMLTLNCAQKLEEVSMKPCASIASYMPDEWFDGFA